MVQPDTTTANAAATSDAGSSASTSESNKDTSSSKSSQAVSSTERGWDGWPTTPTPDNLIPKLGRLPVSSTVHFQTVAMTKMYDDIPAGKLRKIKASMLKRAEDPACKNHFWENGKPQQNIDGLREWVVNQDLLGLLRDRKKEESFEAIDQSFAKFGFEPLKDPERASLSILTDDVQRLDDIGRNGRPPQTALSTWARQIQPDLTKAVNLIKAALGAFVSARQPAEPAGAREAVTALLKEPVLSFEDLMHRMDAAAVSTEDFDVDMLKAVPSSVVSGIDRRDARSELQAKKAGLQQKVVDLPVDFNKERSSLKSQISDCSYRKSQLQSQLSFLDNKDSPEGLKIRAQADEMGNMMTRFEASSNLSTERQDLALEQLNAAIALVEDQLQALETTLTKEPDPQTVASQADLQTLLSQFLFGIEFNEDRLDPMLAEPDTMDTPAEGVILYQEQGWTMRSLALGNLLHSVALAPGEVTQVAMTHWNHITRSTDSEETSQQDATAASDLQNRAVQEIQDAALREHTNGGSDANSSADSSASATSSTSLHFGLFSGAGIDGSSQSEGHSHNVSHVTSYTGGDKEVAMMANQAVAAVTQRHAEAARTRRATVVREVAQSEDENLTTRVLANYNHMHALTVMYFEVIEIFDLKTRVVDAERVIFLPFVVSEVTDLISKFRAVLIDAARAARQPALAEAIRHYQPGGGAALAQLEARVLKIDGKETIEKLGALSIPDGELPTAKAELKVVREDIAKLPGEFDAKRAPFKSRISALSTERSQALQGLPAEMAGIFGFMTGQSVQVKWGQIDLEIAEEEIEMAVLTAMEQVAQVELKTRQKRLENRIDSLRRESARLNEAVRLLKDLSDRTQSGPFYDNKLYFNQAVWLRLSPGEVMSLARRRYMFKGEVLCERMDPAPVAVSGNYVAYRWRFDDAQKAQEFKTQHVEPFTNSADQDLKSVISTIAVPTGGVFGEAVLGQGVSAEKIDLSRFWNWKDSMIPILPTSINPLAAAKPTMQTLSAEPGKLDESSAKLAPLQDLPAPSGFGALAQTMQAQVLRDMSGQAMLQSLAEATTKAAASSEQNAASIAAKNLQAGLDFLKDMSSKAMSAMAASETGGAVGGGGVIGDMLKSQGGSTSLLGGVLNASDGKTNGDLLSSLTGGKGSLGSALGTQGEAAAEALGKNLTGGKADDASTPDSELEPKPSPSA